MLLAYLLLYYKWWRGAEKPHTVAKTTTRSDIIYGRTHKFAGWSFGCSFFSCLLILQICLSVCLDLRRKIWLSSALFSRLKGCCFHSLTFSPSASNSSSSSICALIKMMMVGLYGLGGRMIYASCCRRCRRRVRYTYYLHNAAGRQMTRTKCVELWHCLPACTYVRKL